MIHKGFGNYVKKGQHKNTGGDDKIFNLTQLKKHFNIGNLYG